MIQVTPNFTKPIQIFIPIIIIIIRVILIIIIITLFFSMKIYKKIHLLLFEISKKSQFLKILFKIKHFHIHYYFITSFTPSYYCFFIFIPTLWIDIHFVIRSILLIVLLYFIIAAFFYHTSLVWFDWVLWHINHHWLFNAESCFYIYIKYI